MPKSLYSFIDEEDLPLLQKYIRELLAVESGILLRNDIIREFKVFLQGEKTPGSAHSCWRFLRKVQEAVKALSTPAREEFNALVALVEKLESELGREQP